MSGARHLVTQAEFARILGVVRSRVSAYKDAGRLVMVDNLVDVAASRARIAETRHSPHDGQGKADIGKDDGSAGDGPPVRRIDAQARKDHLAAELLQIDLDERRRKLVKADDVVAAVTDAVTVFRTRLEALPGVLAPQLAAAPDEQVVRAILAGAIEAALADLAAVMRTAGGA